MANNFGSREIGDPPFRVSMLRKDTIIVALLAFLTSINLTISLFWIAFSVLLALFLLVGLNLLELPTFCKLELTDLSDDVMYEYYMENGRNNFWVAEVNGQVIGGVGIGDSVDEGDKQVVAKALGKYNMADSLVTMKTVSYTHLTLPTKA